MYMHIPTEAFLSSRPASISTVGKPDNILAPVFFSLLSRSFALNPDWQNLELSTFSIPKINKFQLYKCLPRLNCIFGAPANMLFALPRKYFAENPD